MVSIKRPVLLNLLVWFFFLQNALFNDLVYLQFWKTQFMKIKEMYFFVFWKNLYQMTKCYMYLNFKF